MVDAPMPRRVVPMLATSGDLPEGVGWTFEVKWDGVRAISYVEAGDLHVESRNLADITPRYPELSPVPDALRGRRAVLDGEVVAFDESGRPSFGRLQSRMHLRSAPDVRQRMQDVPVAYLVFDIVWLDGRSLFGEPYSERRAVLESLSIAGGPWMVPASHPDDGPALLDASRVSGLEGVMAKRLSSTYEPGRRTRAWVKVKNHRRQEVVVGGWLPGGGTRSGRLGALLVGYYERTALRYAGRVGTGFSMAMLGLLGQRLAALARADSPFADAPRERYAQWVDPVLVADVEFSEWTHLGTLRHPSFKGLLDDRNPREVTREP